MRCRNWLESRCFVVCRNRLSVTSDLFLVMLVFMLRITAQLHKFGYITSLCSEMVDGAHSSHRLAFVQDNHRVRRGKNPCCMCHKYDSIFILQQQQILKRHAGRYGAPLESPLQTNNYLTGTHLHARIILMNERRSCAPITATSISSIVTDPHLLQPNAARPTGASFSSSCTSDNANLLYSIQPPK